jgi:transcriptional regulator with XRE-family HTH domain
MPASQAPTVRQRRLGAALRQLRDNKSLSSEEVGERLGWSASKISRIETARIGVRVSDVRLLLELYGVEEHQRGELLALAHDAGRRGWWADYANIPQDYAAYIAFEDEADHVLQYESHIIPGLLQTEEYAKYVIAGSKDYAFMAPRIIDRHVEVRMRRKQLLQPPRSLRLSVLIDEAVLLRRIGDNSVMARQLEDLIEIMRLPNVSLRVLALDGTNDPVPILGSFILLEFSPAYDVVFPDLVHTEGFTSTHTQDDNVTHAYRLAHEKLSDEALQPAESRARIAQIIERHWWGR